MLRRLLASATCVLAVVLLYYEIVHYRSADSWFWIAVTILAGILAVMELLSPKRPPML